METSNLKYKTYFDEFEVQRIIAEPSLGYQYTLFKHEPKDTQVEQIEIFKTSVLECIKRRRLENV